MDLFAQNLTWVNNPYCFPPIPLIGMVLNFLKKQKKDCVVVLPAPYSSWVNLVPKKYPHAMIAVRLCFANSTNTLTYLHA